MITMMIGIIHANDTYAIDFENEIINPKDRVVYTGQGYFSVYYDGKAHKASAWEVTYSKDKVNWRNAVTDSNYEFLDSLVSSSNRPTSQVIETNDGYMVRRKNCIRHGLNYVTRDDNIILLDKNFNVLKSYSGDYVSDMSYINGVYYINTYSQYGEYIPETHMNVVSEEKSYYSTDFENWHVYNESGGIPIINDGHELFIRNGKLQYKYNRYLTQGLGDIALSQNGVAKQGIIYESVDIGEIIQVHDYLFANLVYDGTNCPDKIAVSKDGVYFTIISIPEENCWLSDVFELKDNRFEFDITNSSKYYSCPIEQIDEALNVSDIYVQFQDKILGFETPPVIESGSTLVPMRFLFEQMGADVEWNGETQTATATLDNTAVTFAIDDTNAEVNNTPATMDVPARLINGKTMVPLRFLSEEMGFEVAWDAESRTAIIE